MVKWFDGCFMSGKVLPVVMLFTGRRKYPTTVSWSSRGASQASMSTHISTLVWKKQVGYVAFKCNNASMKEFFEWVEKKVLTPSIVDVREAYGVFKTRVTVTTSLLELALDVADVQATRDW